MELVSVADATTPASEPARQIVLRTERLSKQFGKLTAVQNLNLEVHRGDVFGLLGPNGSGKTTTLRMLLGLIWPSDGQIYLFGDPMTDDHLRRRALQRIGAIVEQPAFYPYLSSLENLRGVAVFAGLPDTPATRGMIRKVQHLVKVIGDKNQRSCRDRTIIA